MSSMATWIEEANRRGASREPFFFLIDFEKKAPVIIEPGAPFFAMASRDTWLSHPRLRPGAGVMAEARITEKDAVTMKAQRVPDFQEFSQAFNHLRQGQIRGETWLANLTFSSEVALPGHQGSLLDLAPLLSAPCLVWYRYPHGSDASEFICFTPEPFVHISGTTMLTRPMKGTIRIEASEEEARQLLLDDEKELAEHITVVDLLRNDLGTLAQEVSVPSFRYVERINTGTVKLLATSSRIEGLIADSWNQKIGTIMDQVLPAGSISGAPKQRTMELIKEAEQRERGYYTGIAGYFNGQELETWVLIRFLQQKESGYTYQSGVGLTLYSDPEREYQELLDKIYLPLRGRS